MRTLIRMGYITKKDIRIPGRDKGSHKGENGRVLIVGGSQDYAGALALAGIAALRSGCDLVTIAAPVKVAWAINCLSADLITVKLPGKIISAKHEKRILELAKKCDCVLVGNGIGTAAGTRKAVRQLVKNIKKPLVIDADGIKAISLADVDNAIITPHRTELEILLKNSGQDSGQDLAVDPDCLVFAKKALRDNVILLKGEIDSIISKKGIICNRTGNAGMTVGGTGDVLAGLCAGFVSQGLTRVQSAINAAYFCGLAGDALQKKKGYTYIASDVAEEIKRVLK